MLITGLFYAGSAHAIDTIKSATVERGAFEVEHKGGFEHDQNPARDDKKEFAFEMSYGFTENYKTKIGFEVEDSSGKDFVYKKTKIEHTYQFLSQQKEQPIDMALYGDVGIADRSDSSHDYTLGILLGKNFDKTGHKANLLFKQDFGDTAKNGVNVMARWQSHYKVTKSFAPGFEAFYDSKKKDDFKNQSFKIGPAVFGGFSLGTGHKLGYELGYYFGITPSTPDGSFKWKMKYEMYF